MIAAMLHDPESHGVAKLTKLKVATEKMRNPEILHLAQGLERSDPGWALHPVGGHLDTRVTRYERILQVRPGS